MNLILVDNTWTPELGGNIVYKKKSQGIPWVLFLFIRPKNKTSIAAVHTSRLKHTKYINLMARSKETSPLSLSRPPPEVDLELTLTTKRP